MVGFGVSSANWLDRGSPSWDASREGRARTVSNSHDASSSESDSVA